MVHLCLLGVSITPDEMITIYRSEFRPWFIETSINFIGTPGEKGASRRHTDKVGGQAFDRNEFRAFLLIESGDTAEKPYSIGMTWMSEDIPGSA